MRSKARLRAFVRCRNMLLRDGGKIRAFGVVVGFCVPVEKVARERRACFNAAF